MSNTIAKSIVRTLKNNIQNFYIVIIFLALSGCASKPPTFAYTGNIEKVYVEIVGTPEIDVFHEKKRESDCSMR